MSQPLLMVSGVSKRFGGVQALTDVGLSIQPGQVHGLIGPNGAGKTTFFNVITGLVPSDQGRFELAGLSYKPTAVHKVAKAGIARTFQNIRLFAEMSALDNVRVGAMCARTWAGGKRCCAHPHSSTKRRRSGLRPWPCSSLWAWRTRRIKPRTP